MNDSKENLISINKIKIGMSASVKKIIKLNDIKLYLSEIINSLKVSKLPQNLLLPF